MAGPIPQHGLEAAVAQPLHSHAKSPSLGDRGWLEWPLPETELVASRFKREAGQRVSELGQEGLTLAARRDLPLH